MRLDDLAGRLDAAGDELAGASTTMALADPGSRSLGGDAPGRKDSSMSRAQAPGLPAGLSTVGVPTDASPPHPQAELCLNT